MKYGLQDCLRDLIKIHNSTASDDDQTSVTFFLLSVLQEKGATGVATLIQDMDQTKLGNVEITGNDGEVTVWIRRPGLNPLVVKAGDDELCPWVDVQLETDLEPIAKENSKHTAFYSVWEEIINSEVEYADIGAEKESAVYLIATLESQVMNGGFGQYLTNTDGLYLSETFNRLERIGATKTHAQLQAAVELANEFDSYAAAWDENADKYTCLDDAFLEAAEDLAGLTAAAYFR